MSEGTYELRDALLELVESLDAGIAVLDERDRVLYASPSAERLLGGFGPVAPGKALPVSFDPSGRALLVDAPTGAGDMVELRATPVRFAGRRATAVSVLPLARRHTPVLQQQEQDNELRRLLAGLVHLNRRVGQAADLAEVLGEVAAWLELEGVFLLRTDGAPPQAVQVVGPPNGAGSAAAALAAWIEQSGLPSCLEALEGDGREVHSSEDPGCVSDCPVRGSPERPCVVAALRDGEAFHGGLGGRWIAAWARNPNMRRVLGVAAADVARHLTLRRVAAELEATRRELAQSQRLEAIGRVASGVAHDFNNVLTAISGSAYFLESGLSAGDPLQEDVRTISRAVESASRLTRQLLAFSRRQPLAPEVTDLNGLVRGMAKMLVRVLGEDVALNAALAPDLPPVYVDPGQVEQVILNLAVNARDAMPDGGTLTLETSAVTLDAAYVKRHVTSRTGDFVLLAVTDTGCGMDAETQAQIFEPFFTTKPSGVGTGLGLSTVYGIVRQSGGFIYVYSEPGLGTTFKVYLPVADEWAGAPDAEPDLGEATAARGETILVAEDNPAVRRLAARVLRAAGYRVLEADGLAAGLREAAEADHLDLLLADVVMPGGSGRLLAEALRADWPDLPVLYMSGYTENAIVHHGVLDGDVDLLHKPFGPRDLLGRVRRALDRSRRGR